MCVRVLLIVLGWWFLCYLLLCGSVSLFTFSWFSDDVIFFFFFFFFILFYLPLWSPHLGKRQEAALALRYRSEDLKFLTKLEFFLVGPTGVQLLDFFYSSVLELVLLLSTHFFHLFSWTLIYMCAVLIPWWVRSPSCGPSNLLLCTHFVHLSNEPWFICVLFLFIDELEVLHAHRISCK